MVQVGLYSRSLTSSTAVVTSVLVISLGGLGGWGPGQGPQPGWVLRGDGDLLAGDGFDAGQRLVVQLVPLALDVAEHVAAQPVVVRSPHLRLVVLEGVHQLHRPECRTGPGADTLIGSGESGERFELLVRPLLVHREQLLALA